VAVKIKLMRLGKIRAPHYRVVVADARTRRDGRAIETIGKYHPKEEPSLIEIDSERAQYWLSVGAQPTEPVTSLLKITGGWQKFHGLPGTEGTLRVAEAKPSKLELFQAALVQAGDEPSGAATTAKKRTAKKAVSEDGAPVGGGSGGSGSGGSGSTPAETAPAAAETAPAAADAQ